MTVPEYLREKADVLDELLIAFVCSDQIKVTDKLREIAERWEKMDAALEDAMLVAKGQWAEVNNNPGSHRRDNFEFYQEALAAARAPLEDKR